MSAEAPKKIPVDVSKKIANMEPLTRVEILCEMIHFVVTEPGVEKMLDVAMFRGDDHSYFYEHELLCAEDQAELTIIVDRVKMVYPKDYRTILEACISGFNHYKPIKFQFDPAVLWELPLLERIRFIAKTCEDRICMYEQEHNITFCVEVDTPRLPLSREERSREIVEVFSESGNITSSVMAQMNQLFSREGMDTLSHLLPIVEQYVGNYEKFQNRCTSVLPNEEEKNQNAIDSVFENYPFTFLKVMEILKKNVGDVPHFYKLLAKGMDLTNKRLILWHTDKGPHGRKHQIIFTSLGFWSCFDNFGTNSKDEILKKILSVKNEICDWATQNVVALKIEAEKRAKLQAIQLEQQKRLVVEIERMLVKTRATLGTISEVISGTTREK